MAKFPLYLHANGQWAKTIRGRKFYFGTDKDAAVDRYLAEKDYLLAGRTPPTEDEQSPTLAFLGNVFIDRCKKRAANGVLSERSVIDYIATIRKVVDARGREDMPAYWSPRDYGDIKELFFQPVTRQAGPRGGTKGKAVSRRSPVSADGDIARLRAFLNWCHDSELIPAPRYGQEFEKSSLKERRIAQSKTGRRDISAADINNILAKATPYARPVIMLAINCGAGAADIAAWTLPQIDGGNAEFIDCPRNKTGSPRRIWLWPETRLCIREYLEIRKTPSDEDIRDIAFLTRHRTTWARDNGTGVASQAFLKARRAAGVERGTFYDLRRTFQTVAEETLDFPAVKFCMGHAASSNDMSAVYRQAVSDERIHRVCSHMRDWFLAGLQTKEAANAK